MQLADHFKHTKIINQKDRKIKPLIGITEASRIRDIREIVKNQRKEEWGIAGMGNKDLMGVIILPT